MTPKEYAADLQNTVNSFIEASKSSNKEYKFTAHERIFKLILNLSTLSLTGWVAIVSWNFEAFPTKKDLVFFSCKSFIVTLILICAGDVAIVIQSLFVEILMSAQQSKWLRTAGKLNGQSMSIESGYINQNDFLISTTNIYTADLKEISKMKPKTQRAIKAATWISWVSGIAGVICFFYAVWFSVNSMTEYVAEAQRLRSETNTSQVQSK